jgi:hypothetical protein
MDTYSAAGHLPSDGPLVGLHIHVYIACGPAADAQACPELSGFVPGFNSGNRIRTYINQIEAKVK